MWTHDEYDSSMIEVLKKLQGKLQSLDKEEAMYAKIVAADVRSAEARIVVFSNPDLPSAPVPFPPGTKWKYDTHYTTEPSTCWYECIYDKIDRKLNDLSISQSCHAKICFTDAESTPASITIYWLE